MKMPRPIALTIPILFMATMAFAQSGPPLNRDPEKVKFVTSDIENFWRAYDLATNETHDEEIWRDFEADMYKPDISKWMYSALAAKDRPADLGYYVGYLITRAYYKNAKDKRQAVHDILNIQDARKFYEASGVREKLKSSHGGEGGIRTHGGR